jgi:hypothetical protein
VKTLFGLLFIVALGAGYLIAHSLGASVGWSNAAGWGTAIAVLVIARVVQKREGYRATIHVEKNRAAAVYLRKTDPETYRRALALADGTEAEAAARRDPDAYVALVLHYGELADA